MKHRIALFSAFVSLVLLAALISPAAAGPTKIARQKLQMYEAVVDAATVELLTSEGYDVASIEDVAGGFRVIL